MAKFRTRARALDMLGRQQIRGIPTAISELFKNAHDAYAAEVRVDYLRDRNLLIIRDDGVGMSPSDFVERWLTIGTESKLSILAPPAGQQVRAQLGEKGIGRLAIAAVSPQVLVMTRARSSTSVEVLASFINWRVFEEPGINLDQIEIPTLTVPDGGIPSLADLRGLCQEAAVAIADLGLPKDRLRELRSEISGFPLDSVDLASRLPGPSFHGRQSGTHFFLSPVDSTVPEDLVDRDGESAELIQDLVGFANPLDRTPVMGATFWDWTGPGQATELIGPREFWTEEDLEDADHEVRGKFDEFGIFHGQARVYDKWFDSMIAVPGLPTEPTLCGPFAIRFGYLQGVQSESRVEPTRWHVLSQKLNRIAGLYVYRDGIRILPYGRHNFDWLDIERNRTKSAGYYFFSYRRMFGYVAIDREHNSALSEKAGREGFRENQPYRQFRRILSNFFVQLAADFFREGGGQSGYFRSRKDELERQELARRESEKRSAAERRRFVRELGQRQRSLAAGLWNGEIESIVREAQTGFGSPDGGEPAAVSAAVRAAIGRFQEVRQRYRLEPPVGVGVPDEVRRDWEAYQGDWEAFAAALDTAEAQVRGRATEAAAAWSRTATAKASQAVGGPSGEPAPVDVDALVREQVRAESIDITRRAGAEALAAARDVVGRVERIERELLAELDAAAARPMTHGSSDAFARYLGELRDFADRNERLLHALAVAAASVDLIRSDGEVLAPSELSAATDQEVLTLREQVERDLELAQLGLAVEVVGHEFRATINAIRRNLRSLNAWAKRNPGLVPLHSELQASFEHLDSYLTLFTPLQRRVRSEPTELSGGEIFRFLSDLFHERLAKEAIQLEATDAFRKHLFEGRPAVFYPVFVNLVDNASFWLADRPQPRTIRLDRIGDTLIVEDTGPGIPRRDRPYIFEPGFTRKPAGRGLGLFISREVLRRNGYRLAVDESGLGGARFEIERARGKNKSRE